MFPHPSQKFFRQMLVFGFIVWITTIVVEFTNYDVKDHDESMILTFNYFGAVLSPDMIWLIAWVQTILFGLGLVAMIAFKGWGRFLILGSMIIDFFTTSFMGLVITTGSMDMLSLIVWTLTGIPFVLSFFEPCSSYFSNSKKQTE